MADHPRWLYHSKMLMLLFILHWSAFSQDIMLAVNDRRGCAQPVVCKQALNSTPWSWSFVIFQENHPFAVGKSVYLVEGDVILLSSWSHDLHHSSGEDFNRCSINCTAYFTKGRYLTLRSTFNLTRGGRQSLYDTLSTDYNHCDAVFIKDINILLSKERWETLILFTSLSEGVTDFSSGMSLSTSKLLLFTLGNNSQLNDTLDKLYTLLEKKDLNFILLCSTACIVEFLSQVYQFEIAIGKTANKWLVTPTEGSVEDIVSSSMRVPAEDIVVMDVVGCSEEYSLGTEDVHVLLPSVNGANQLERYVKNYIDQIKPRENSSVSSNVYMLSSMHNVKSLRPVGHISQDGHTTLPKNLFPGFTYGLNNQTITVGALEWPPFVVKQELNGSVIYTGMCIDLLKELSRALNFSYKIVEPEDGEWGRVVDGRWTGLVGLLANKSVDLVAAPITVFDNREDVMDFTVPYHYERSGFVMMKPDPNANKWMTLVAPFRYEVHICILVSLIFSTVFLFGVEEIHPVNMWADNRLSARRTRYGDILWYHFGAMMANGGAYLPSTQAGRSILSFWWLFTVICAAIYSGNLIAVLTDWREEPPFTTLAKMVEQDTYKWGTLGSTAFIDLFKNSNQSVYKKIWWGLESDSILTSNDIEVHKSKVLEGQYAFLGDESVMESWKLTQCDLNVLYDPFFMGKYAIGLPNNSPYTSLFSHQVLRINEIGLPREWYKRSSARGHCKTAMSAKRVDLLALQSAFYAAGVGVFISLCVLMTEVIHNRKCREHTFTM